MTGQPRSNVHVPRKRLCTSCVHEGGFEGPENGPKQRRINNRLLSYRPQHRGGTLHKYLIVRWFNVFRKCAESSLRYKTATFPIHLLCTIANSRFLPSWNIQDRKSTRLNSSHGYTSYAVFFWKKKRLDHC